MRRFVLACVIAALPAAAHADARLMRTFGYQSGLAASSVSNFAQDTTGFLWIATAAGLYRFDGREFTRVFASHAWLAQSIGVQDEIVFSTDGGLIWSVGPSGPERITGRDGAPVPPMEAVAVSQDGTLWMRERRSTALTRRAADGTWTSIEAPITTEPVSLFPGRGGSVLVIDRDGVLRIDGGGTASRVVTQPNVLRVDESADGRMLLGWWSGRSEIGEVRDGAIVPLRSSGRRLTDLARRGDAVWIGFDTGVEILRPGQPLASIGTAEGLRGCNDLLVDREGSVWIATYEQGVTQLPEPDTVLREMPGFAPATRCIARTRSIVWIGGWFGTQMLDLSSGAPGVLRAGPSTLSFPCAAGDDEIWTVAREGALSLWGSRGEVRALTVPHLNFIGRCALAGDGGRWIPGDVGLLHMSADGRRADVALREFPAAVTEGEGGWHVFETRAGTMFLSQGTTVCRREPGAAWACEALARAREIVGFAEPASGDVWAATSGNGLYRFRNGAWTRLPGSDRLATQDLYSIAHGADGTFWLSGNGIAVRVAERRESADGFDVVESLSSWQGMTTLSIAEVREEPDGTLYVGAGSLITIPASARHPRTDPPAVAFLSAEADGRALDVAKAESLPYRRNRLEIRFAAPSYRDPSRIRYRTRLHTREAWSAPSAQAAVRFVDLAPGRYDIAAQASLDGERWTEHPPTFSFRVLRPWYLEAWFFVALATLLAATIYVSVRLRLAQLLRLERQRARIAMDLHDELGSGLGSIGLLSEVLSRDAIDGERRRSAGAQLGGIATDLSSRLTDIVWSLKPGSATLDSLAAHLVSRAGALFPDERPRFVSEIPGTLPVVPLSLAVRRNVFLIGLEAMHNAVTHANASEVRLSLTPEGRSWRMAVIDDGRGLPQAPEAGPGHGLGLTSMRRRAGEIGAALSIAAGPDRGTEVTLVFSPDAEGRSA